MFLGLGELVQATGNIDENRAELLGLGSGKDSSLSTVPRPRNYNFLPIPDLEPPIAKMRVRSGDKGKTVYDRGENQCHVD